MATYVLLLTLTPQGREQALRDSSWLLRAEQEVQVDGTQCLGLYATIGQYDFVGILEAPANEAAAHFSLEFGVSAGAHITTLPALPIGLFAERDPRAASTTDQSATLPREGEHIPADPP